MATGGIDSNSDELTNFPTQRCSLHKEEVVKLYCKDHDVVECASCIDLNHSACEHVVSISEDIDNLYKKISPSDVDVELKRSNLKKNMEEIKKTNETKFQMLKEELNQEIESVKAYRQELQELLDVMERETIQVLKREFTRIEASFNKDINEVNTLLTSYNEVATQLKKSKGNKAQVFVCVKSHQKLATKLQEAVNNQQMTSDETVCFTPDHSIKTFLLGNKSLGYVSVEKSKSKVPVSKPEGQIYTPKGGLYRVKQRREIDVKLQNDKNTCNIWGSCTSEDGYLLLPDYNNKRLKCMDLTAEPKAVCTISKTKALVSLGNKSVQFVSLGDTMTVTRTLTMTHFCYGLAYSNGKLFVSDRDKTLYIHDMNGHELKTITQDPSGRDIFQQTQHIAVSANGDRVYVTDWNKGVVVLDSQGNYLSTLTASNVLGYGGVCTDGRNIFVSGRSSNNIVQFGQDFRMLGEIAKVTNPYSLCFDNLQKSLISTCLENDKVTILELE